MGGETTVTLTGGTAVEGSGGGWIVSWLPGFAAEIVFFQVLPGGGFRGDELRHHGVASGEGCAATGALAWVIGT